MGYYKEEFLKLEEGDEIGNDHIDFLKKLSFKIELPKSIDGILRQLSFAISKSLTHLQSKAVNSYIKNYKIYNECDICVNTNVISLDYYIEMLDGGKCIYCESTYGQDLDD